ncbi:hypothetical protein LOK49_LG07G00507 [Camellia lanceoleosa]|uniref:Uncharacterized protein n=1 Tax=Camellia lanceoleosa TaxID=1840588 RepID=A0ACC0H3H2_9ERIC|nr:hypothetical protein LOK49_LG07G00507 [Camellia lanceoleosa]
MIDSSDPKWDDQGSVLDNYKAFDIVSIPNFLGVRSCTSHIIESESLQIPSPATDSTVPEFSGSTPTNFKRRGLSSIGFATARSHLSPTPMASKTRQSSHDQPEKKPNSRSKSYCVVSIST